MPIDLPIDDRATDFDLENFPLTADQRSAVVYNAGPVIVLAGPGTGKTRVITARVAHMIADRGVSPDQIVAVTFTNKAAGELGDRLGKLVGDVTANRVVSSTFHSLGLKIIRRFGDVLGVKSEPILIDSSQRRGLIRELINEHKLYRYVMGNGIESAIEIATKVMDELRNQGMSSKEATGWLGDQRGLLGAMEQGHRDARATELDRFEQAVMVYGHFEAACLDRGWMVFDDLILLPTRLMREHANIASILRYDHKHVVVDEFQDVNRAQIEFVRALCPPESNPDLCVVGDDDQGIYGFRGADDRAFAHFAGLYTGTKTITLKTNFRSSQAIVAASNAVIDRAQVRFDATKQAQSDAGEVEGSGIELVRLEGEPQSGEVIAAMLLKMASEHKNTGGTPVPLEEKEGFDFGSCAVIARTKNELEMIARVLMLEGIPVDIREHISPMDDEGVRDVIAWARLLGDPGSTVDIKRILVRPPYRCDVIATGRLIATWKAKHSRWAGGDEEASDPGLLMDWLVEHADESFGERVSRMHVLAQELGKIAIESPAATTIMEIVKRTGVVHSELSDGRARASRVASLVALIGFARSRADRFDSPGDLAAMLRYWEDLDPGEKSLGELPESLVEQSGQTQVIDGAGNSKGAVAMLTAHASKGLEFDTVFVPRVSGPHGYPKSSGGDDEVVPDGLIDRAGDVRDGKSRRMDEERRVFYVAITRAQRRAVVLAKVPKKPSSVNYVFELREELGNEFVECEASDVLDAGSQGDAVSRLGAEFKAVNRMRDVFDQAKHDARRQAAMAIDLMEQGEIDRDELGIELRRATDQIGIVRSVLADGVLPDWVAGSGHEELGRLLIDTLSAIERDVNDDGKLHPGLGGPLMLSFSQITKYLYCPRCYLVNYVLRLPQESAVPMLIGTAVHEALDKFYTRWRIADAEGSVKPGGEELKALVDKEFFGRWPRDEEVDMSELEKARALVATVWNSMHSEDAHIEELEQEYVFKYECEDADDGLVHKIKAKLDRVDATSSGGRRVIDYKTGKARKELVKPSKTDLQFGIYAMALEEAFGDLGPGSVCEYWLLADGSKGVIGMDALDMKKIRKKIDQAISGMLAGDWEQSSKCCRDCQSGRAEPACSVLDRVKDFEEVVKG